MSRIVIVIASLVKYDSSTITSVVVIAIAIQTSGIVRFVIGNSWLGLVRILGSVLCDYSIFALIEGPYLSSNAVRLTSAWKASSIASGYYCSYCYCSKLSSNSQWWT